MPTSHKRPGCELEITTLYVAIGRTPDGDEGIIGKILPSGLAMPIVFSGESMIEMMAESIRGIGKVSGEDVEIVEFQRVKTVKIVR